MTQYQKLLQCPPTLTIKENAREVVFTLISAMCDNESTLVFAKKDGDFKANLLGQCFGNLQTDHDKIDLEWTADDGNWEDVIQMINTGTSRVSSVRSR